MTDAIAGVIGERVRSKASVELVGTPAGHSGVGGAVLTS